MKTSNQFTQIIYLVLSKFQQVHFQRKRPCCILKKMHSDLVHLFPSKCLGHCFWKHYANIIYPFTRHLNGDPKLQVLRDFALKLEIAKLLLEFLSSTSHARAMLGMEGKSDDECHSHPRHNCSPQYHLIES